MIASLLVKQLTSLAAEKDQELLRAATQETCPQWRNIFWAGTSAWALDLLATLGQGHGGINGCC